MYNHRTSSIAEATSVDRPGAAGTKTTASSSSPQEGITAGSSDPKVHGDERVLAGPASGFADSRAAHAVLRKLQWLDGVVAGAHHAVRHFNDERAALLWESGTDSGYYLDWRSVQHYCSPELILVLRRDPSRVTFDEHPFSVIVPLVGLSWSLLGEHWFEEIRTCIPLEQRDEAVVALNTLDGIARTMDPKKRSNAMSVLATAKRLFQSS